MSSEEQQVQQITELTEEQRGLLDVYRDTWTGYGLNTDPANKEGCIASARMIYEAQNLPFPERHHFCRSPVEAAHLAVKLSKEYGINLTLKDAMAQQLYGNHDAPWLSFFDYVYNVLGIKCVEPILGHIELAKHCGRWSPYDKNIIFQDRPTVIRFDDEKRLHSDTGPALAYSDGVEVFIIHGVRVPREVVMEPDKITVEMINNERNAEVRRIMLEKYGFGRFLEQTPDVHFVSEDDFGQLYYHDMETDNGTVRLYFVKVTNGSPEPDGSFKQYILTVTGEPTSAGEAVASTYKISLSQYKKMNKRT